MNGQERKTVQQIAKTGRLRDSTSMFEEIGGKCAEDLQGLFISKLNFHETRSSTLVDENGPKCRV